VLTNAAWDRFAGENGGAGPHFGLGSRYFDVCERAVEAGDGDVASFASDIRKLFDGAADQISFEYPCHSPTMQRWFRCDGAAIKGSDRWCAVIMHSEVTARVVAEQHLRRSMTEAESASRAKSSFLANMSHELRTPLNAIVGFAQLLEAQTMGPIGNDKYREYAGDIVKAGEHLIGIISHILDLAMVEAGKLTLDLQDVAADRLVEDAVHLVLHRAEAGQLLIRQDVPVPAPHLEVDEGLMRQVLVNLLINAIKYTPAGGTITVAAHADADGRVLLSVSDTGVGIRPEELERVFEPFHQVASPMVKRNEGVGLGLPLVRAITHLHGADVRMRSAVGQGTTVEIRLPPRA
jgi:signal transduction histidine kinase